MSNAHIGRHTPSYSSYVGRFAPSPSGPLHFGSLVTALGSYLQAKSQHGKWLVRIEDIDPPREIAGAADDILRTLELYHLYWDEDILYQSSRTQAYEAQIHAWLDENKAYYCQCPRKQIKALGTYYSGTCRHLKRGADNAAIRLHLTHPSSSFVDARLGEIQINQALAHEDFIIKRRDGLYAYNLAVVIDDVYQGVTEVVRGADLLDPTCRQISLYHELDTTPISYLHLPLAMQNAQLKYSKQNKASAIPKREDEVLTTLIKALTFLGIPPPQEVCTQIEQLLTWAISAWSVEKLPNQSEIIC